MDAIDELGVASDQNLPADSVPSIPDDLSFLFAEQQPGVGDYEMGPDGNMALVTVEDDLLPALGSPGHTANLAEQLDESAMASISSSLLDLIEDDIESRKPWTDRYRRGMEMMGLLKDETDDGPFPGAATAVMPIISESTVQFWARALSEQVPSDGPVKGKVMGKAHQTQIARADRVAVYMNHDLMVVDRGWYADHSRMLFALPVQGTTFKKTFRDHALGRNTGEYVAAEDLIANYAFTSLDTAPRYTHRIWRSHNELRKLQVAGVYRDISLGAASHEELPEESEIKIEIQDIDGDAENASDSRHELYEVYCELDIPGFEELDEYGRPTGIALPYIVTIDKHTEKVLSIYRNWKEQDPLKRARVCFTKYDFLPGFGFYGLGFFHLIGGLQEAATGALRVLLDGAATASLQGGLVSKDASLKAERLVIEPGVYKQVDASYEDLQKAFYTPPFREPSPALFQVLGFLVQRAEKFSATTETMTGSQDPKGSPVGSVAQLIEQGAKVFSTVHRGLHRSLGEELRLRFDLIQEFMPVEGYPYDVEGAHEGLMTEDFAPGISVLPVSDPNIFTQAQRVAQAQAVYDLAMQNPQLIKLPVALRRVLESINVPDIDELMVEEEPPPPMDPISEVQALLRGEPVQAYPDQMHAAYLQHYAAFLSNPEFGGNPQVAQQVGPAAVALVGQRLAYAWAMHARALGAQAPMLPPPMQGQAGQAGTPMQGGEPQGMPQENPSLPGMQPPMQLPPPEVIAQMAAQIAPQMAQVPGMPSLDAQAQAEDRELKQAELQLKQHDAALKTQDAELKKQQALVDQESKFTDLEIKRQEMLMRQEEERMKWSQMQLDAQMKEMEMQFKTREAELKMQVEEMKAQNQAIAEQMKMRQEEERHRQSMAVEADKMAMERERMAQDAAFKTAEAADRKKQQDSDSKRAASESESNSSVAKSLATVVDRLSTQMSAPKQIIRDAKGNIVGVGSGPSGGTGEAKPKKKK